MTHTFGKQYTDAFYLTLSDAEEGPGVTLSEYHEAFLTCPLFSIELAALRLLGLATADSTSPEHLSRVARGQETSFALWTEVQRSTGDEDNGPVGVEEGVVMSNGFERTWWGVDKDDHGRARLIFGTGLEPAGPAPQQDSVLDREAPDPQPLPQPLPLPPLILRLIAPLHRLYSRVLLVAAKNHMVRRRRQRRAVDESAPGG